MDPNMGRNLILLCFCMFYADFTTGHGTYSDINVSYVVTEDDLMRYEDCVGEHLRKHPDLADRFSEYQLTSACKRYENWHKNYPTYPNLTRPTNYTHLQKKYIDRIQYCRNYDDCYGDTLVDRRRMERLKNPKQ